MKTLPQINRFYIVVIVVLVALAVFVIVVLRGVFGAIAISGEIDDSLLGSNTPRLDKIKIERAIESVGRREPPPLDL